MGPVLECLSRYLGIEVIGYEVLLRVDIVVGVVDVDGCDCDYDCERGGVGVYGVDILVC